MQHSVKLWYLLKKAKDAPDNVEVCDVALNPDGADELLRWHKEHNAPDTEFKIVSRSLKVEW